MSRDRISGERIKVKGDAHTHGSDKRVDIGGSLGSPQSMGHIERINLYFPKVDTHNILSILYIGCQTEDNSKCYTGC